MATTATTKRYASRYGNISAEKAQIYGNRLSEIETAEGLTPRGVVDTASDPNDPLHDYFEWDNDVASDLWRMQEARQLIRAIVVVEETDDGTKVQTPAWHSVHITVEEVEREDDEVIVFSSDREYVSLDRIVQNEDYQIRVLQDAISRMRTWLHLYREFNFVFRHFSTIEASLGAAERELDRLRREMRRR